MAAGSSSSLSDTHTTIYILYTSQQKHIIQVNRERVIFVMAFTVTNEKGEIQICNFSCCHEIPFTVLRPHWLKCDGLSYGHCQPSIQSSPTRTTCLINHSSKPPFADVVPIEKYGELEAYIFPSNVWVNIQSGDNAKHTRKYGMDYVRSDCTYFQLSLVIGFVNDSEH